MKTKTTQGWTAQGESSKAFAPQIDLNSPMPLYAQVKRSIQAEMLWRGLQPGDKFPSENELVRKLGLSRSTVARAVAQLANDGVLTRRKGIGTFVKRINRLKTEPALGSIVCLFGLLLGKETLEEFFLPLLHSVERTVQDYGHRCSLMSFGATDGQVDDLLKNIGMGYYSGVVLLSQDDDISKRLRSCGVPTVAVAALEPELRVSSVYNDNELGSKLGLMFLRKLGRNNIGVIGGPLKGPSGSPNRSGVERIGAAQKWVDSHGAGMDFIDMQVSTYDPPTRKREIMQFIEAHGELDAIFALHDSLAIDSIAILSTMGVKIPDQVAVVGYDDTLSASQIHPSLTTVGVNKEKIGEMAAKLVVEQVVSGAQVYTVSRVPPPPHPQAIRVEPVAVHLVV